MQAIKAIYDGVNFKPKQPIPVNGQYEVVITFVEQLYANPVTDAQQQINNEIEFWKEFDKLAEASNDEILSIENFPRTKFNRELVVFEEV